MRVVRSGAYLAIVPVVVAVEWSPLGVLAGLLYALVGMAVTAVVRNAGLLAGAAACGARVHSVDVGIGPRLFEWRKLVVRACPLALAVEVGRRRTPHAVSIALGATAVIAEALLTNYAVASGGAAVMISASLPARRGRPETPGVLQVFELVQTGELDAAERLVSQLTVAHPDAKPVRASRVLVLEARGRYAEALTLAIGMSEADGPDGAAAMAAVAGLTGAAIEAGQLDAQAGLPVAARALNEAVELGKPSYTLDGVRALIALLAGEPQLAVKLARAACKNNDGSLGRADDLATLARAYMAAGDNSAARKTLAKAERLVPWWPRVALTRSRLDLA